MRHYLNKKHPVLAPNFRSTLVAGLTSAVVGSMVVTAQDTSGDVVELSAYRVIGNADDAFLQPGSGYVIAQAQVEAFRFDDINNVLKATPGLYLRQEDAFGLFPNISLRGADSSRSGKVTLLEDGVPIAPALYSAPSAYFAPNAGRMEGFEVLKGSSQVRFGPHTTGGVINYISRSVPTESTGRLDLSVGTDEDYRAHLWYGDEFEVGEDKSLGYVAEVYYRDAGGMRAINPALGGGYAGSDDTGLERTDYLFKTRYRAGDHHTVEAKIGFSDIDSGASYLGLSTEDFALDAQRRYAASRMDNYNADQTRTYLRHTARTDDFGEFVTTVYYNHFKRNWYKLDKVDGTTLSKAVVIGAPELDVLRGAAPGQLKVKANNRSYSSSGVETKWLHDIVVANQHHEFEIGVRYHTDYIRRYQWSDLYDQDATGAWTYNSRLGPDTQGDRRQESDAWSVYLEDSISVGALTLKPGVRWEHVRWDYFRADKRDPAQVAEDSYDYFVPGLGATYLFNADWLVFGGAYRGVSPTSPSGALKGLKEESSNSFELGLRKSPSDAAWFGEVVLFRSDFNDLIVAESIGSGTSDENVGEVIVQGIELQGGLDLHSVFDLGEWEIPLTWGVTYTDAVFDGASASTDPESIFFNAMADNDLPYIPEWHFFAQVSVRKGPMTLAASLSFVDETYGTGDNLDASPTDVRVGKIDAHTTVDFSARYQVTEALEVYLIGSNVFDEVYVASRLPHGLRAGPPARWRVGVSWDFGH